MLTEFGGMSYVDGPQQGVHKPWGYSFAETRDEFARHYVDLMNVLADTPLFSGFCYTQFADTFQETNGLLTADRKPKFPLEEIAKATQTSRSYIPGWV